MFFKKCFVQNVFEKTFCKKRLHAFGWAISSDCLWTVLRHFRFHLFRFFSVIVTATSFSASSFEFRVVYFVCEMPRLKLKIEAPTARDF